MILVADKSFLLLLLLFLLVLLIFIPNRYAISNRPNSEQSPRILTLPWDYNGYYSNINFTQYNVEQIKDLLDRSN